MRHSPQKTVYRNKSRGFTILETLVAISILVLALTAPLAIVAQALRSSYYARDQVTAYFLAQEAVEFLRNKRDNAGLQSAATAEQWTDTFLAANDPSSPPSIDTTAVGFGKAYLVRDVSAGYKLVRCNNNGADCPVVSYSPSTTGVLYGDDNAIDESIFTREITISEAVAGNTSDPDTSEDPLSTVSRPPALRELVINVRVRWRMANGDLSDGVTIREHLTNWQLEKTPPVTP